MKFNIINISSVGSTNSHAMELIGDGKLTEGDIFLTNNQKNGKGQGDNVWESEPNSNITLSIVLQPHFVEPANQFVLTQIVSLAIVDTINSYLISINSKVELRIKWPNDIYIDNCKIAGILFQNYIVGNKISYSIAGIGININQLAFTSGAKNPISLIHHINNPVSLDEFLDRLLNNINNRYELIKINGDFIGLQNEYLGFLYRYKVWAKYSTKKSEFIGKIIDIDVFGRLLVEMQDASKVSYMFKEIEFVI